MKILSMTATFGKLSHETLTLKPGLNVIHAPNEWGKSTWCAFLVAMLYGIDTRERSTQTTLADKERYAPWSGEVMSGRMDILWQDKKITIERRTKGRSVFGDFRAYETESGLPVPELTAANCGQVLLGVEKSVFTRSAFLRLTDLPVTQDESLRRRLNALVTTGDESGAGDALAQKLKDLKNRCRHNRTGLLPQAEEQRKILTDKLTQLRALQTRSAQIRERQSALEQQKTALENHRQALEFQASRESSERLEQAKARQETAARHLADLTARCQMLPTREFACQQLSQLRQVQLQQQALDAEVIPSAPLPPQAPALFEGMTPSEALQQTTGDRDAFIALSNRTAPVFLILSAVCILAGVALAFFNLYAALACILPAALFAILHFRQNTDRHRRKQAILSRYGTTDPEQWVTIAQRYADDMANFTRAETAAAAVSDSLSQRKQELRKSMYALTQGLTPDEAIQKWTGVVSEHDALEEARRAAAQAAERVADLASTTKPVAPPQQPDPLTLSAEETTQQLVTAGAELRQLQLTLGQCLGQMDSLGQEDALTGQLQTVDARIEKLEDVYSALTIAMETLTAASDELQRRFAPRIAQRAQALFHKLTNGRYDRLQLTQDLSLHAGAEGEDTLRASLWRSDGTADQLYLALRLAVAAELIPDAPLVLDDALVRFDDDRLALAMGILKEESLSKQVILFTCQTRETNYI